jgi:uncharacterized protein DUF4936
VTTLCYYIYYRVAPEYAPALESRIKSMQAALFAQTGIAGRLMRKRGEPLLWMEIYEEVADALGFEAELQRLVAAHCLIEGLQPASERKTECFVGAAD